MTELVSSAIVATRKRKMATRKRNAATRKSECDQYRRWKVANRNLGVLVWPYFLPIHLGGDNASCRSLGLSETIPAAMPCHQRLQRLSAAKQEERGREREGKEGGHSGCPRWPA